MLLPPSELNIYIYIYIYLRENIPQMAMPISFLSITIYIFDIVVPPLAMLCSGV